MCLVLLSLLSVVVGANAIASGSATPGSLLGVDWYAGFVPIPVRGCSSGEYSNSFYWYFPSSDPTAPVTLYLEGGPGIPGTFTVFNGPGPFRLQSRVPPLWTPPDPSEYEVLLNPDTWLSKSSLLFIDNPIGVGFSQYFESGLPNCGNPYPRNITDVGEDLVTFLRGFISLFPETAFRPWHLAGHSYGGKYVLGIANALLQSASPPVKIGSLLVLSGLVDTLPQARSWLPYGLNLGLLTDVQVAQMQPYVDNIVSWIENKQYHNASAFYYGFMAYLQQMTGQWQYNTFYVDQPYPLGMHAASYRGYSLLMNSTQWREAFGIYPASLPPGLVAPAFSASFYDDVSIPYPQLLMPLLSAHIPVLVVNGDADWIVTARGVDQWLSAAIGTSFYSVPLTPWCVPSVWGSAWPQNVTAGSAKQDASYPLTFLVLRNAGHFIEYDQSFHALQAFTQWIETGSLALSQSLCPGRSFSFSSFLPAP